jgi:hypothetical protein
MTTIGGGGPNTTPVIYPFQKKVFYANGRWWAWFFNGTNFGWVSSTDGTTWAAFTAYSEDAASYHDLWYDPVNNKICVAHVSTALYYRQGTANSDGTITWDSAEVQVAADAKYPKLCKDSNGFPWISYVTNTGYYEQVIKASAADGSAWANAAVTLWTNRNSGSEQIGIVPLTGGKMLAISVANTLVVQYRAFDGTTWAAAANYSTSNAGGYNQWDAVADGDNCHLAFYTNLNILYVKYVYGAGAGTEETVESSVYTQYHPSISRMDTDRVRVFYIKSATTVKYRDRNTGTWATAVTVSSTETKVTQLSSSYAAVSSKFGLLYKSDTPSANSVIFVGYTVPAPPTAAAPRMVGDGLTWTVA